MFQWIKERLDQALIMVLSVAIVGMIAYLITPRPTMTFTLQPVKEKALLSWLENHPPPPAQQGSEIAVTTVETSENFQLSPDRPPSRHHVKKTKAPKKIPIVFLNRASLSDLDALPGIGPKLAQRILKYRQGIGQFQTIEELLGVKGIGAKNFAKMKPYLRL